jgi:hypothetical protein
MAHALLATSSQEGTLHDVVFALESILNALNSRTTTTAKDDDDDDLKQQRAQVLDVLNGNSLLSLLKSRYPNKRGELMTCVSLLFFIPAIESSGPTGAQHKRLVNALVSTVDSPMSCAVRRGCAETVEAYLALLVLSKVILSAGNSSIKSKRVFKTADYKALTFLEWLGQVKFFGRSKKKDDTHRALYGEWVLHAGNDDDTLHVLTQNEYTLRDLASLICTSPFGRMILTRPNFFSRENDGADETTIDYEKVFASAALPIVMGEPSTTVENGASNVRLMMNIKGDDPGQVASISPSEKDLSTTESAARSYTAVDVVVVKEVKNFCDFENNATSNAGQTIVPILGDMQCSVTDVDDNEEKEAFGHFGDSTAFIPQQTIVSPSRDGGMAGTTARSEQTVTLVEEDYEDVRGGASGNYDLFLVEEEDIDFHLVVPEEYLDNSMAMDTDWEILSS